MALSYKLKLARFSALLRIQDGAECGKSVAIKSLSNRNCERILALSAPFPGFNRAKSKIKIGLYKCGANIENSVVVICWDGEEFSTWPIQITIC